MCSKPSGQRSSFMNLSAGHSGGSPLRCGGSGELPPNRKGDGGSQPTPEGVFHVRSLFEYFLLLYRQCS